MPLKYKTEIINKINYDTKSKCFDKNDVNWILVIAW